MKRFSLVFVLCFLFSLNVSAQEKVLRELLDLPAPPPFARAEESQNAKKERPLEFYGKVPPDDAPIDDLLDYWETMARKYSVKKKDYPSEKSTERMLDEVSKSPKRLKDFLNVIPSNEANIKRIKDIFEISQNAEGIDEYWQKAVKNWLKFNSDLYIDELLSAALKAKDKDGYIEKQEEIIALARIDFEKAQTIIDKFEDDKNNPRTSALIKTILYQKYAAEKETSKLEQYRDELKKLVKDTKAPAKARDLAIETLFSDKWDGQDDFYLTLIEDKTLLAPTDGYRLYEPLTTYTSKDPEKWIPIMTKLLGNPNRTIHTSAVQNLMEFETKESFQPLIPWLFDKNWADINWSGGDRVAYMQSVSRFDLPESIPGLIWIVENEDDNAHWAASSLKVFKSPQAVPALKNALQRIGEEIYRQTFIEALLACNGLSDLEQMSALEIYAEFSTKPENAEKISNLSPYNNKNPLPVEVSIGRYLSNSNEPSEGLIRLLFERQKILRREKPATAEKLSEIISNWKSRLIDLEMIGLIDHGEADLETVLGALMRRKELREKSLNDIYAVRGKSGLIGAVAACILEDENDILSAFHSEDLEKRIATLGCARLLRKPLPVPEVGGLMNSENKLLALAAERYLEAEDSPEAREFVWAKHPNEVLILGARDSFNPAKTPVFPDSLRVIFASVYSDYRYSLHPNSEYYSEIDKFENKLREEVKSNGDLLEVYAVYPGDFVRVYKDRAVYTWIQDSTRYYEGVLKKEEFAELKNYLERSNFENTAPIFGNCHHNCGLFEYVRLNKNGGRRFFSYTNVFSFIGTQAMFQNLRQSESVKLKYFLNGKIKGLEVLLADKKFSPRMLWKNGDDFRLLISDEARKAQIEEEIRQANETDDEDEDADYEINHQKAWNRRNERSLEHFEWREFKNGKLGERTEEPQEVPYLQTQMTFPADRDLGSNENYFQARFGNYEIRNGGYGSDNGLWKYNRSEKTKFAEGWFGNEIIVSGNWAVVSKTDTNWAEPNYVVRVNLQTGKQFKVNLPPAESFYPVAFVATHNKVLLYRAKEQYSTLNPVPAEHYLLDVATGKTELVKGEFHPLHTLSVKPFQSAGNADEVWATVYSRARNETEVGVYNMKTFSFKSVLKLPDILLNTEDIHVDEKENKVYFIYSGDFWEEAHLLSVPLKQ
ncbi:MAG TPA: hypothetical protein PKY59_20620 [Pyrinomonadaceae bacterium]|nr:hypothetical protein [Pyrinomonadaceae bacterium]